MDCVILVADLDTEYALKGLLARPESLNCRSFMYEIYRHPRRDPGVRLESPAFLRQFVKSHNRAIAVFDWHGSGAEFQPPAQIEQELEAELSANWQDRAAAVVIEPELESWIWSDSPQVDQKLGWAGHSPSLRQWLLNENLWLATHVKPKDPKQAYERALSKMKKAKSASIFEALGRSVSTRRCTDRAFVKLRQTVERWFPRS